MIDDKKASQYFFSELCNLKCARVLLTALQATLSLDIARLEKQLRRPAHYHGINSIPDEILAVTLIYAASNDTSGRYKDASVSNLALVSKRFYTILENSHADLVKTNLEEGCAVTGYASLPSIGYRLAVAINKADRQSVMNRIHECRCLWLGKSDKQYDFKYALQLCL